MNGNTSAGRFTTQAAQAAGDEYVVNMGSARTFNEIQMAAPDDPTDYASSYSVEVSPNGSSWSVVATCTGTGTPQVVSFPAQTGQYVEVVLNAATPTYWWSIEYFYVYSARRLHRGRSLRRHGGGRTRHGAGGQLRHRRPGRGL